MWIIFFKKSHKFEIIFQTLEIVAAQPCLWDHEAKTKVNSGHTS